MDDARVAEAVETLKRGGLVAFPTETVYGLGADASNELAVRRIFSVKGRPSSHPLIVHLPSFDAVREWAATVPPVAETLAKAFWPGPLTLVFKRSSRALDVVTAGQDTVALRVPGHPLTRAMLEKFGGGMAGPSANRFGKVSPTTAEHVRKDLGADVDLILDGGPSEVGVESTIVDVSSGSPALLRPGGLALEELERVLGSPVPLRKGGPVRAPGMLASHYAPAAGVEVVERNALSARAAALLAEGRKVGVLAPPSIGAPPGVRRFAVEEGPDALARVLYATLREVDEAGLDLVLVAAPERSGRGLAILDRLARAAAPRP